MPKTVVAAGLLCLLSASGAAAQDAKPVLYSVQPGKGRMTYKIVHKLHEVVGTSTKAEVKVAVSADGQAKVMGRVPVSTFTSESDSRDVHMREVAEADKFPLALFKGVAQVTRPAGTGTVKAVFKGELDFHGVKHPIEIPVEVAFTSPTRAHVTTSFEFSLDAYSVERPALLFVKIDDACRMTGEFDVAVEGS